MKTVKEVLNTWWKGGRTSLHLAVVAGTFPPPLKISARRIAWRESDLEEWENNCPVVNYAPVKDSVGDDE